MLVAKEKLTVFEKLSFNVLVLPPVSSKHVKDVSSIVLTERVSADANSEACIVILPSVDNKQVITINRYAIGKTGKA